MTNNVEDAQPSGSNYLTSPVSLRFEIRGTQIYKKFIKGEILALSVSNHKHDESLELIGR